MMKRKFCFYLYMSIVMTFFACNSANEVSDPDAPANTSAVLPIMYVNTENGAPMLSKDEYVVGTLSVVGGMQDSSSSSSSSIQDQPMKIKGRGNSTWQYPKKPYKIKFDSKIPMFGEAPDKEWVLLANYLDKSLLRNDLAFYMGGISNLEYTSCSHFVQLYLNGEYCGVYQLSEQLKIAKSRVNVGDDGFLLEIDAKAESEDITFNVPHIEMPINIKEPDVEVGDASYNYITEYLRQVDEVLFSENFTDSANGYTRYLDVETFVDWYLINEITKNADAIFYTSCYMHLARNGKLKMGPLWDFDLAFGGYHFDEPAADICNNPEGFWIKNVKWYSRLFQDPYFVQRVKDRFEFLYSNRDKVYSRLYSRHEYLKEFICDENSKWHQLCDDNKSSQHVKSLYVHEAELIENWLEQRFQWLRGQFSSL